MSWLLARMGAHLRQHSWGRWSSDRPRPRECRGSRWDQVALEVKRAERTNGGLLVPRLLLRALFSAGAESLRAARRFGEFLLHDLFRHEGMLKQLCDLVAAANLVRTVTKILGNDENLAAIPGIDHTSVAH